MGYPLGSFPRFGHQERWAQERRQRAIANSIANRQARANLELNIEIAFYNWFTSIPLTPNNEAGRRHIASINKSADAIREKLEKGERVYFKRLGKLLQNVGKRSGRFPELLTMDDRQLADVAREIGVDELSNGRC